MFRKKGTEGLVLRCLFWGAIFFSYEMLADVWWNFEAMNGKMKETSKKAGKKLFMKNE